MTAWSLGPMVLVSACAAATAPRPVARGDASPVLLRDPSGESPVAPFEAPPDLGVPPDRAAARTIGGSTGAPRQGRLIDLDVKDADIADVCRLLADVGRVNIVVADDAHGRVTARLKGVPWDEALDVLTASKGLRAVRERDVIVVKPLGK